MPDPQLDPEPTEPALSTLAEAEVIARHAGELNWWVEKVMEEYDRRGDIVTAAIELVDHWATAQNNIGGEWFKHHGSLLEDLVYAVEEARATSDE